VTAVPDSALNLLGLALRGGNLAVGEDPVGDACRAGRARVVLLAADAAENTAQRAARLIGERDVPLVTLPWDKGQVGGCLGRSACALAALTDAGLAAALLAKLAAEDPDLGETAALLAARAERTLRRKRAKAAGKPPRSPKGPPDRRRP
jgi:ribosomal protein L7Ae-like RNA K-turn-binding protein